MAKRKCLGNSGSRNLVLGDLITNLILVIKQLLAKRKCLGILVLGILVLGILVLGDLITCLILVIRLPSSNMGSGFNSCEKQE